MIFELGFSFVIQQLAAHESIHLQMNTDGSITGDREAHARLASALQLSLRWYTLAAAAMILILAPVGIVFFTRHAAPGAAQVAWMGPWIAAVISSAAGLWCTPFYSFLEGCGYVRAVAAMRLRQSIAGSVLAWAALLLHHGLYAPSLVLAGYVVTGIIFLSSHRGLLKGLLRYPAQEAAISWNREIWPFQWRIAVSWMCSCFTVQLFIPILFALRGAVEAGQMGMSISITGFITVLALSWSSTKTTPFGRMIARHEFQQLDRMFLSTLRQSLAVFGMMALCACGVAAMLPALAPQLVARLVMPQLFAVLVLAAGSNCVVQCMAILLRSFKCEPFLMQSIVVASLTLVFSALTVTIWGNVGATFSYFFATSIIGMPYAGAIFVRARREYLSKIALVLQPEVSG
jgi:hypothetical protein